VKFQPVKYSAYLPFDEHYLHTEIPSRVILEALKKYASAGKTLSQISLS
jgi:hypothetical protein